MRPGKRRKRKERNEREKVRGEMIRKREEGRRRNINTGQTVVTAVRQVRPAHQALLMTVIYYYYYYYSRLLYLTCFLSIHLQILALCDFRL
jgi:hypothetical protein